MNTAGLPTWNLFITEPWHEMTLMLYFFLNFDSSILISPACAFPLCGSFDYYRQITSPWKKYAFVQQYNLKASYGSNMLSSKRMEFKKLPSTIRLQSFSSNSIVNLMRECSGFGEKKLISASLAVAAYYSDSNKM